MVSEIDKGGLLVHEDCVSGECALLEPYVSHNLSFYLHHYFITFPSPHGEIYISSFVPRFVFSLMSGNSSVSQVLDYGGSRYLWLTIKYQVFTEVWKSQSVVKMCCWVASIRIWWPIVLLGLHWGGSEEEILVSRSPESLHPLCTFFNWNKRTS